MYKKRLWSFLIKRTKKCMVTLSKSTLLEKYRTIENYNTLPDGNFMEQIDDSDLLVIKIFSKLLFGICNPQRIIRDFF